MKKFLALVLALIMTMSLVTISAGAEFTDADDITYVEAVEVMTAAGVVSGDTNGNFNPTAGLTRGAAAKIICNMILGPTTAGALTANDAPFSDVAADNVFAGYIAYCVNEGIISGYADGTFKPAAPLTGYAFMKMLLGALGYDAATEGYVGSNWSIQVAKRALNIGLDSGLKGDFAGAKALTREEALLYAFNAMKANVVAYDNNSKITVGDIVVSNISEAKAVEVESEAGSNYIDNDTLQFVEKYFEKLVYTATDADAFGRPAHSWDYDNADVGTYVDTADVVFTAATKADDVAKALKGYKFGGTKLIDKNTAYAGDGDATWSETLTVGDLALNEASSSVATDADVIATVIAGMTANGKLVELYFDKYNNLYDVVAITYTVDEVVKVVEKADKTTYTFDVSGAKVDWVDEDKTDDLKIVDGDLAKGDIVTVATAIGGKLYVYATESVTGAQSSKNAAKETITVGGTVYTVGTGVKDDATTGLVAMADFDNSTKTDNTYYVDQFGFVVKTTAASASSDYALIVDVYGKVDTTIDGGTPSVQVRAVLEDGTVGVYDVALTKVATGTYKGDYNFKGLDTTAYTKDAASVHANVAALENNVFGYTLNGTTITLENAFVALAEDSTSLLANKATDSDTYNINKNDTSVLAASEETVLLTKDSTIVVYDTDTGAAKAYAGTADLGNTALKTFKAVVEGKSATLAQAEVVFVELAGGVAVVTENYAFIDVSEGTEDLTGDDATYTYSAVLPDGETVDLVSEEALVSDGLYKFSADKEVAAADLLISTADSGNSVKAGTECGYARMYVSGDMAKLGSSGTVYYDISAAEVVFVAAAADAGLDEVNGNLVFFVLTIEDGVVTKDVEAIYVFA